MKLLRSLILRILPPLAISSAVLLVGCSMPAVKAGLERFNQYISDPAIADKAIRIIQNPLSPTSIVETVGIIVASIVAVLGGRKVGSTIVRALANSKP